MCYMRGRAEHFSMKMSLIFTSSESCQNVKCRTNQTSGLPVLISPGEEDVAPYLSERSSPESSDSDSLSLVFLRHGNERLRPM